MHLVRLASILTIVYHEIRSRQVLTPFCKKCCLDTTKKCINAHTQGEEKADCNFMHSCHQVEYIRTAHKQVDSNEYLVYQGVNREHDMASSAISMLNELEECMSIWRLFFQLDCQNCECQDRD